MKKKKLLKENVDDVRWCLKKQTLSTLFWIRVGSGSHVVNDSPPPPPPGGEMCRIPV